VNALIDARHDDPLFGYRFLTDELNAGGIAVSENTVHALCKQHRLWSLMSKRGCRKVCVWGGSAI